MRKKRERKVKKRKDKIFYNYFYSREAAKKTKKKTKKSMKMPGLGSRSEPRVFGSLEPEPLEKRNRSRSR